jgi:hypothetical protein
LLCNLPVSPHEGDGSRVNNPLYKLGLHPFISALVFVASQFTDLAQKTSRRRIDTKGKNFAPSRRNADAHALLCRALPVFSYWPENYFSFLDERQAQKRLADPAQPEGSYFQEYKSALFVQLAAADFEFMRSTFREYRRLRRYESYMLGTHDRIKPISEGKNKQEVSATANDIPGYELSRVEILKLSKSHVSGKTAKDALRTTWPGLEGLIASGRLKAIIGNRGGGRVFLIEKASLEDLKRTFEHALFLRPAEHTLGLNAGRIKELITCGLLNPVRSPQVDGYGGWRFDQDEVADLVSRLVSGLPKKRQVDSSRVVDLKFVLRRIARINIGLGTFLQAVMDGEIKPCGRTKETGLRSLLFRKEQIDEYVQSELRLLVGDALSLTEVAKLLRVRRTAVRFFIRKELLRGERFSSAPLSGMLVKREAFDSFNDAYILARRLASAHSTSSAYIFNLLSTRDIRPISGPKVDGGYIHLFRQSDVESLDIASLISEEKKRRGSVSKSASLTQGSRSKSRPESKSLTRDVTSNTLDESQAAEMLGLDVEAVRQLTERGSLKRHKRLLHQRRKEGKYYYSNYTVQKYKERSVDHTGLISFTAAAKRFELWPDNFYNRFVKTGRLKPAVDHGRRSEHFFRMEDVEALLKAEEQTILTPEAAEVLGVNVSCVEKMMRAGVLRPISGPAVDGFGKNLFLKSDVEKLHAERQAFKAERIKEGKTSRFGRRPGPGSRPVRDLIGPRIDQLLEQWRKQSPSQHISGYRVYRQLVSEGYQLGTATVYVYLRQKHCQAA